MLLPPSKEGLHSRLIDAAQTKQFHDYCRALAVTRAVNFSNEKTIAADHFELMGDIADLAQTGITRMQSAYPPAVVKALRRQQPVPREFAELAVREIMDATAQYFRTSARASMPLMGDAVYSYPFRYGVACYALAVRWISDGGIESVPADKLRNDFVDMTYSAYASFFDGLITRDTKLREVHELSLWMLAEFFGI